MGNQRESERVGLQRAVLFGKEKPPKNWAYITDVSDKGIFIKTNQVYPAGTLLYITIKDYNGIDQEMSGEVMRSKKIPPAFYKEGKSGMGVNLIAYDKEFLKAYEEEIEKHKSLEEE